MKSWSLSNEMLNGSPSSPPGQVVKTLLDGGSQRLRPNPSPITAVVTSAMSPRTTTCRGRKCDCRRRPMEPHAPELGSHRGQCRGNRQRDQGREDDHPEVPEQRDHDGERGPHSEEPPGPVRGFREVRRHGRQVHRPIMPPQRLAHRSRRPALAAEPGSNCSCRGTTLGVETVQEAVADRVTGNSPSRLKSALAAATHRIRRGRPGVPAAPQRGETGAEKPADETE